VAVRAAWLVRIGFFAVFPTKGLTNAKPAGNHLVATLLTALRLICWAFAVARRLTVGLGPSLAVVRSIERLVEHGAKGGLWLEVLNILTYVRQTFWQARLHRIHRLVIGPARRNRFKPLIQ